MCDLWKGFWFDYKILLSYHKFYITLKITSKSFYLSNGFALRYSLFWAVKLNKNVDLYKYSCSGYCISFDIHGTLSLSNSGGFGKIIIIFDADMSSSVHVDNKKRYLNSQ